MLIPAVRKRMLMVFWEDPFKEIHLRELARRSKSSATNVASSMQTFVKEGLFKKREAINATYFMPNLENEETLKVFEFLEMERRKSFYTANGNIARLITKYTDEIRSLSANKIQLAVLFGSVARGEWKKGSDIDILAVVAEKDKGISIALNKGKLDVSPLLEIRAISTTIKAFSEGLKTNGEFYGNLWKDRVVLYNDYLFWQMVKDSGGVSG